MSRLTEANFEEIYLLVRDIAARAGEGDAALEEPLEAMAVKFRVIQVLAQKQNVLKLIQSVRHRVCLLNLLMGSRGGTA